MKINLPKLYTQVGNFTPIGTSTINAIGCLTVDASMTATYFGHPIDPSTLAKTVKYQGNLWIWSELNRLYPDIVYKGQIATPNDLTDLQMNQIKDRINVGYPVFLEIRTSTIPTHWLLAVDYNGDDFLCADPLKSPPVVHPISDYGIAPRKVIYTYAWYEGKVPVVIPPTSPELTKCLLDLKVKTELETFLRGEIEKKDKQLSEATATIVKLNSTIADLTVQRDTCLVNLGNQKKGLIEKINKYLSTL